MFTSVIWWRHTAKLRIFIKNWGKNLHKKCLPRDRWGVSAPVLIGSFPRDSEPRTENLHKNWEPSLKNVCPETDEVCQLQGWLVSFRGTLQSYCGWKIHRFLFSEVSTSEPSGRSCVDYHSFFPLFPVTPGKMAPWIPRGLWTAAVMMILVVLSVPVAEGRDSPRKCRAPAPRASALGDRLWRTLGWSVEGSVISEYSLLSQVSSLWGRQLCYVLISTSKDEDSPHPMGLIHPRDVTMGSRKRSVHLLPLTGQSDIWVSFENKNILKIRK